MSHTWRGFTFIMTACLLGGYDPKGELSIHLFTAAITTATLLVLPFSLLPKRINLIMQAIISSIVIVLCLVDVYCQTYLLSGITPNIFITMFLTNAQETAEFLKTYLNLALLSHWRIDALAILLVLLPLSYIPYIDNKLKSIAHFISKKVRIAAIGILWCCVISAFAIEAEPISHFVQLFAKDDDAQNTESLIFRHYHEEIPTPIHRTLHAWFATKQSGKLLNNILNSTRNAQVDSCSHKSPHIVLIIGESYNKHHSSLYGYPLQTTPLQQQRQDKGELFVFDDVVTPWNITSNVFLNMFSTWNSADKDDIGLYPLFPALFKKAGYKVTFFSNQYVTRGFRKGSTNQAGYFFLSNKEICDMMFDYRNPKAFGLDMRLVNEFQDYKEHRDSASYTLDIIHLIGQHFDYKSRYPENYNVFKDKDVPKRNLDKGARKVVMHYDNATHYDDIILNRIITLFEDEEAIILFVADHGEEVYDDLNVFGRLFQTPTWQLAHQEFEVPMWIWCSDKYKHNHTETIESIKQSLSKPLLTDEIHNTLLDLGGIKCPWYKEPRNVLSIEYKPKKRIIAGEVDYDDLN